MKSSLPIAYAMKKKSRKSYADGGSIAPNPKPTPPADPNSAQESMRKAFKFYKDGGMVDEMAHGYMDHEGNDVKHNGPAMSEDEKDLNQHMVNDQASTSMAEQDLVDRIMAKRNKEMSGLARLAEGGPVDASQGGPAYEDCYDDMVDRIMMKRHGAMEDYSDLDRYSEGGKVANQEHGPNDSRLAGFDPNEFDDLVLRDDLTSSYGEDDNAGDALGNDQEDEDRDDIISRIMRSRKKKDRMPNPA